MTLLARALYDNLADAPDELSFRKGDIVTVIERDVDGIVGWWLCLLHGRQGIVPGNRLQIITPVEVNSSFRNAGSQGSLSADDLSDSFDANFSDGVHGPEYDILPAPVKATHGQIYDYPSPKNIKDVYTSDRNSGSLISYPNYATPKTVTTNSDYDFVPSNSGISTKMSPAELYDIPQAVNTTREAEQLYDFPSRRPTIQQKTSTPSPRSSKPDFQNVVTSFTSIPAGKQGKEDDLSTPVSKSNSELYGNSDIYDTPKSMKSASQELYDVPPSLSSKVVNASGKKKSPGGSPSDLYDVIPAKNTSFNSAEELYDVPPSAFNFRNDNASLQKRQETGHDIYNVPTATNNNVVNQIDNNIRNKIQLQNANGDPRKIFDYLPRKEVNNRGPSHQEDIYDHPPARQDIRDQSQNEDIYDHPPARQNIRDQSQNEDIYDHPPARQDIHGQLQNEDIYDHPPARQYLRDQPQNEDIYDHPPARQDIRDQPQNEDIYDHPPARQDIYDHPPSQDIYDEPSHESLYDHLPRGNTPKQPQQESIYDRPPNRNVEDNVDGSQGLYDVPTQHDIGKVMRDISQYETSKQSFMKPYGKHRRERNNANLPLNSRRVSEDDDDYVDYQDIYGKEPPAEMVKEMEKSSETTPRSPPPKTIRKHSSFEQINMEAVKELKITQKQAFERLSKLHLAVDTSVTTLVAHTSGDWLAPTNLSHNIDAIKDMSAKVKLSLRLLTEFGLGAVVNARVVEDSGKMADTIKADIEPLLECYYKIKVCILHLDGCKWKVPDTREKETEKFFATVNAIMILGSRVPEACRKLTGTLHYSVKSLFSEDPAPVVESSSKPLTERMENLRLKSQRSKSPEPLSAEKGKLKQVQKTVDAKKVREILELDTRSKWNWSESDGLPVEKPEGADLSPHEMRKEFQSRRQQGYNSTLPRRPPVPPKPSLPSNRRSMASTMPDDELRPTPAPSKVDTLVTDFVAEDGRKKYASDPTQSPMEPEPARKPEWGGSCPQLDDRSTYASPQAIGRATSSGTAASTTSTYSSNHDSTDEIDGVSGFNKMPSDSNLYSQTLTPPRVTAPPSPSHLRSASLPWDDNKIPFSSYEKEQRNSPNHSPRMNQKRLSKLDHRDTEALIFFLQRVESQVLILREAVRNLTESVTNNEAPQMFVAHSKFVILTAHKVVHAGEELSGKLMNSNVKFQIKRSAAQLADSIRGVVAGTKQAALDYPNQNSMMEMMTTVLSVGEAVREVHKEAKKGLEL